MLDRTVEIQQEKKAECQQAYRNTPEYRERKKARESMREAMKKRPAYYKSPEARFIRNLERRIDDALNGERRAAPITVLLGIDKKTDPLDFLLGYIEKRFEPGMTRKNYGEWQVDHIRPCATFDLTDAKQQMKCFHYTNLQPLWAEENRKKSKKWEDSDAL